MRPLEAVISGITSQDPAELFEIVPPHPDLSNLEFEISTRVLGKIATCGGLPAEASRSETRVVELCFVCARLLALWAHKIIRTQISLRGSICTRGGNPSDQLQEQGIGTTGTRQNK